MKKGVSLSSPSLPVVVLLASFKGSPRGTLRMYLIHHRKMSYLGTKITSTTNVFHFIFKFIPQTIIFIHLVVC